MARTNPPHDAPAAPLRGDPAPRAGDPVADELYAYLREEGGDRRRLRAAVAAAFAFHALLLLVPTLRSEAVPVAEEAPKQVVVIQPVRFKPPEPPPVEPPEPPVTRVPMPAENPNELEPIREVDDLPAPPDYDWGHMVIDVPQAPPEPEPEVVGPIPVGGDVARPRGIYTPKPEYTEIARKTRTQGPVILQAILDEEGRVSELKVLRGLPMGLTERAVEAVRTWRYEPATLDGRPVEVYMTITVIFKLQ